MHVSRIACVERCTLTLHVRLVDFVVAVEQLSSLAVVLCDGPVLMS